MSLSCVNYFVYTFNTMHTFIVWCYLINFVHLFWNIICLCVVIHIIYIKKLMSSYLFFWKCHNQYDVQWYVEMLRQVYIYMCVRYLTSDVWTTSSTTTLRAPYSKKFMIRVLSLDSWRSLKICINKYTYKTCIDIYNLISCAFVLNHSLFTRCYSHNI